MSGGVATTARSGAAGRAATEGSSGPLDRPVIRVDEPHGPENPPRRRFCATIEPTVFGFELAPTSATEAGARSLSRFLIVTEGENYRRDESTEQLNQPPSIDGRSRVGQPEARCHRPAGNYGLQCTFTGFDQSWLPISHNQLSNLSSTSFFPSCSFYNPLAPVAIDPDQRSLSKKNGSLLPCKSGDYGPACWCKCQQRLSDLIRRNGERRAICWSGSAIEHWRKI